MTPLFRIDPGWPFVIAGLALIVSAVLIPAQRELHDLEQRLKVHQAYEERTKAELVAYQQFIRDLGDGATNERLLERLVRAQLNKMPKDERPLLLMPTANETVPTWIESSVTLEIPEPTPYADTLLSRIASGPRRLWVLATGAFLVFLGVMFAPTTFSTSRRRPEPVDAPRDEQGGEFEDSAGGVATLEAEDVVEDAAEDVEALEEVSDDPGQLDAADAPVGDAVGDAVEDIESAAACAGDAAVAAESESSVVSISASSVVEPEFAAEAGVSQCETATSVEAVVVEIAEVDVAEVEDAEVEIAEVEDAEVEIAEVEDAEVEDAEVEVAEVEDAEVEVAEVEDAEVEDVAELEPEPQICSIETFPSDFAPIASHEPETLDSALEASETHEAQDIHELQYDETELDAVDAMVDDDADPGEAVVSAETAEPPEEVEPIVERASVPDANDRALDSTSLFAGLDESRWIETRSQPQRG